MRVGSAAAVLLVIGRAALACGSFDEAGGVPPGATPSADGSGPTPDGASGTSEGAAGEGSSGESGAVDAFASDGGADDGGIAPFAPQCSLPDTMESESNDTASFANVFTASACGTLSTVDDIDYLTFDTAPPVPFTVAFACTGDARYTIKTPSGSFSSGSSTAGSFSSTSFAAGTPFFKYVISIEGSDIQDWRLVVRRDPP